MTQQMIAYAGGEMDMIQLGQVLAKSGYFQDARDAAQAIVKVLAGREMGIGPIAAMTGIYIVKGRVTLSANLMAAQIKRSGKYTYSVADMTNERCELAFYEIHNDKSTEIGRSIFTKEDAQQAGLWGSSDPWKKTPRNMLFARAMSNGAKWYTPDVFSGPVYTPDELTNEPQEAEYVPHVEPTAPAETNGHSTRVPRRFRAGLMRRIEELEVILAERGYDHQRESFDAYTDEQLIEIGKRLKAEFDKPVTEPPGAISDTATIP